MIRSVCHYETSILLEACQYAVSDKYVIFFSFVEKLIWMMFFFLFWGFRKYVRTATYVELKFSIVNVEGYFSFVSSMLVSEKQS